MNELEIHIHQHFDMTLEDCQKISKLFKMEIIEKGDYFSTEGKSCNKLSFIEEGILRIFATMPDREITQWIATPGYFLTDLQSFIYRNPSRFTIQALTDTRLYTIDYEDYLMIGKVIPKWNDFEKLFVSKCFVMIENRVFDFISLTAEERYKKLFDTNRELFNQVPLQYLASMLGMTPETFSRIRRKMIS
jgi:CRP-like cAMP-binding protein